MSEASATPNPTSLPSVSLVMATWNGAAYLQPQLDSLAAQTVPPKELIVLDDNSSDDTLNILKRFARSSPFRVRLGKQFKRMGYERNFADAGGLASGELLMFVDQDDIWLPHKIERFAGLATRSEAGLLGHDLELFHSGGEVFISSFFEQFERVGLPRDACVNGCALAVRRRFLDQWGWPPSDSTISHDCWFGLLGTATGDRAFSEERLIRHRIHEQNASGWIPQPEDRMPRLAEALAADEPGPLDGMLEAFIRLWRRDWVTALETALRDRATPDQREAAERALRKLQIVHRWLDEEERAQEAAERDPSEP